MKKRFASLVAFTVISTSIPAFADPPTPAPSTIPVAPPLQPGEPDVGTAISPMKKGQVAPFTGVLLSPAAVATTTVNLNSIKDQVKIEVDHANAVAQAQCTAATNAAKIQADADAKIAQAKLDAALSENKILTDRLQKVESSQPNVVLLLGGGVLVGVGITVLTAWGMNHATK